MFLLLQNDLMKASPSYSKQNNNKKWEFASLQFLDTFGSPSKGTLNKKSFQFGIGFVGGMLKFKEISSKTK